MKKNKYEISNGNNIHLFNQLKKSNSKKKKWIWFLSIVAVLSLIVVIMLFSINNEPTNLDNESVLQIENLQKSNDELKDIITKLEDNKATLEIKIEALEEEKIKLNDEINKLGDELVDEKANVGSLTQQNDDLKTEISQLEEEIRVLEEQLNN